MNESLYTARDVARVFGIQESRVLYWVRTGVVGPSVRRSGRGYFTFQDLISVKAAKELLDRGATMAAVRRNLAALRTALPSIDRPLQRLRVVSNGDDLVVLGDDVTFEPVSGQVVMDFMVHSLSSHVAEVMQLPPREESGPVRPAVAHDEPTTRSAYGWFLHACALDEQGGESAAITAAFGHALALDPSLAAAHTNLGNIAHRETRRGEARDHYEKALTLDPEQPEARYNLANLLEEIGEIELAIAEWTRVSTLCPDFADAHFNLGAALARQGAAASAREHLERYLHLDGNGDWALTAKSLLDNLVEHRPIVPA